MTALEKLAIADVDPVIVNLSCSQTSIVLARDKLLSKLGRILLDQSSLSSPSIFVGRKCGYVHGNGDPAEHTPDSALRRDVKEVPASPPRRRESRASSCGQNDGSMQMAESSEIMEYIANNTRMIR